MCNFVVATLVCSTALFFINVNASLAYDQAKSVSAKDPSTTYNHYSLSANKAGSGANEDKKVISDTEQTGSPTTKPTFSANAGKEDARVAIDVHRICRWVDKSPNNVKNQDLFVPFQTYEEWVAFVNNAPKDIVKLTPCSRPSAIIPPNDPAGKHQGMFCYNKDGSKQTTGLRYTNFAYQRVGAVLKNVEPNPSLVFDKCYTSDRTGPFPKQVDKILSMKGLDADRTVNGIKVGTTANDNNSDWLVTSVKYTTPTAACGTANKANLSTIPSTSTQLCSYGVASAVGGTGPWTWTCRGLKNKASCMANKKVDGSCGSADGKNLTTAPTVAERCTAGSASALSGSGPWTWTCKGLNGGSNDSCSAEKTNPTCPPVSVYGPSHPVIGNIAQPLNDGYMYVRVSGSYHGKAESNYKKSWDSYNSKWAYHSWASGKCYWPNFMMSGGNYNERWVNCIVTDYVKTKVDGYSDMTGSCTVDTDNYLSPLKVNLAERNPSMNSTRPTTFYLTLSDGRIMEGKATGGLNPDEGWLMVHRTRDPLVFKNGALNADNWFGDRDGRSLNGFTDLAETFSNFIETDENGQRFIPLNVLTKVQKQEKAEYAAKNPSQITDPSFDLRVVDARNAERFASDYFSRIYVDYRNVVEADSKDGQIKGSNNIILERGIARTVNGRNTEILDQWFVIDLPADMSPPKGKTKSRILPARK
jgi:hypothetical protein